jgi:hypothetical protein
VGERKGEGVGNLFLGLRGWNRVLHRDPEKRRKRSKGR